MNKNKKIIGISGVAGAGKDTFYSLLCSSLPCVKYSLADELKKEVNQWCRIHYGVDSVACTREEKELIREFLVFHGSFKRRQTNGRHWIDKLNETIIKDKTDKYKVITDIRYDDYENDEVDWLKNELGGVLVHVSQYLLTSKASVKQEFISDKEDEIPSAEFKVSTNAKKYKSPVNAEELRNDPKIKEKSDFEIEWEFLENGQINELQPIVDEFVKCHLQHQKEKKVRLTTP